MSYGTIANLSDARFNLPLWTDILLNFVRCAIADCGRLNRAFCRWQKTGPASAVTNGASRAVARAKAQKPSLPIIGASLAIAGKRFGEVAGHESQTAIAASILLPSRHGDSALIAFDPRFVDKLYVVAEVGKNIA